MRTKFEEPFFYTSMATSWMVGLSEDSNFISISVNRRQSGQGMPLTPVSQLHSTPSFLQYNFLRVHRTQSGYS